MISGNGLGRIQENFTNFAVGETLTLSVLLSAKIKFTN